MPQCSPLGLLSFLLLIDDLTVDCLTHKYVDDTTLTELLPRGSQQTYMHTFLQQLQTWATPNKMNINFTKTKEMIWVLWQSLPLNCYLIVPLTTLSAWKEYNISNLLALLSRMISIGKLTLTR